jgi:hypothetical protein
VLEAPESVRYPAFDYPSCGQRETDTYARGRNWDGMECRAKARQSAALWNEGDFPRCFVGRTILLGDGHWILELSCRDGTLKKLQPAPDEALGPFSASTSLYRAT